MLVVDPSSSCDVCLEAYDWENPQRTPHIIDCGHVFCAECLDQVFPTKCPMCRKIFLPSEVQKLHVDCTQWDTQKEEIDLLKRLIQVHDTTEEEILRVRICVDEWIASRQPDEQSPLRRARDALDQYQQLKQKNLHDHKKIKTLQKSARQFEKNVQDTASRKQAEAAIMEQALRSQLAEQQAQIDQLRAELDKKQPQVDRKVKKLLPTKPTKPLPIPNAPLVTPNPLPSPPRLIQVVTHKSFWPAGHHTDGNHVVRDLDLRLPIYEGEGMHGHESSEDNVAYFTCRTRPATPYRPLEEEKITDEPMLQRPARNHLFR
ncbi:hypothetical protein BDP27DRAFT_1422356 [Rhodocollybia butyracea]|uniref:RING-type domain-containing protein n=1 Tax=Rhodocollybia butyracea TaxID=206335 RepID=A0A9P5PR93_9AGAR|nr:hypothetical protein BDP27DRAFT_1422356 [Rhodocollybia butyracea]